MRLSRFLLIFIAGLYAKNHPRNASIFCDMSTVEELECSKVENGIECRGECMNGVVNLKVCDCHKRNPRFPNLTIFSKHYCKWKTITRNEVCESKHLASRTAPRSARRFFNPSDDQPETEVETESNKIEFLKLDEKESIQEIISKLKSFDKLTYFGFVVENGKAK